MPYRIHTPPPVEPPEGDHPYVEVLAAERRRTRAGALGVCVAVVVLGLAFVRRREAPRGEDRALLAADQEANATMAAARQRIESEQADFERVVRHEARVAWQGDGACPLARQPHPTLVLRENELGGWLPSQSIASLLADEERAHALAKVRPALALSTARMLVEPTRLRQEVIVVVTTNDPPKVHEGLEHRQEAYEPGRIDGRAYLYDFATHRVICGGSVHAESSPQIGYTYAPDLHAPVAISPAARLEQTLADDLRKNLDRSVADSLRAR